MLGHCSLASQVLLQPPTPSHREVHYHLSCAWLLWLGTQLGPPLGFYRAKSAQWLTLMWQQRGDVFGLALQPIWAPWGWTYLWGPGVPERVCGSPPREPHPPMNGCILREHDRTAGDR